MAKPQTLNQGWAVFLVVGFFTGLIAGMIQVGNPSRPPEVTNESISCSRDTYPESYITKYTSSSRG